MREPDEVLVVQAQRGDRAAFEELIRRTARLVFARLYLETGNSHRAEDLSQEALLRAYRSLGELRQPGQFRTWLLTIAQNVLTDSARREARQKRSEPPRAGGEALAGVPGPGPPPEEQAARTEQRGRVLAALRELPEEYRLPLTLRYLAGADYHTIATQLGLSNGSLRGLLHRGLKLLRARLGPDEGDPAGD
jgi:RNA polymerase sigma-70 factor (ECF subfamily)